MPPSATRFRTRRLAFATASTFAAVQVSPERLVQVFESILENAVSFSPNGTVTVRIQGKVASVITSVHDEGPALHCRWVPITFGVEWAHWWVARREETEAAGELWPDPFACQGLPWIPECRELGLSVLVGAGVELPI